MSDEDKEFWKRVDASISIVGFLAMTSLGLLVISLIASILALFL